jgi:RNA binding exosome subunit
MRFLHLTLEDLQSAWEAKLKDSQYDIYHNAIKDGLAKLMKYYCRFDKKPAYIIALSKC